MRFKACWSCKDDRLSLVLNKPNRNKKFLESTRVVFASCPPKITTATRHSLAPWHKYLNPLLPPNLSLFFLHTYLVGATAIKKAVCYDSSPALHSAAARVIELLSGTSLAQFLMVYPFGTFFSLESCLVRGFEEERWSESRGCCKYVSL